MSRSTPAPAPPWRRTLEHLPEVELAGFERSTHPWCGFQTTWDLVVVTDGGSEWRYRGRTMVSTRGSIRFKQPGESFRTLAVRGPSSMRMLRLQPAYFASVFGGGFGGSSLHLRSPQIEVDPARLRRLCALLDQLDHPRPRLASEALLTDELAALFRPNLERKPSKPPPPDHRGVRRVREHIDAHYARELSLCELATLANIHPVYLSRMFREQVGLPPHAYQNERRITAAQAYLRGGMQGAEVAAAVGYFDQSHLIRHFKRVTGVTPRAYCQLRDCARGC